MTCFDHIWSPAIQIRNQQDSILSRHRMSSYSCRLHISCYNYFQSSHRHTLHHMILIWEQNLLHQQYFNIVYKWMHVISIQCKYTAVETSNATTFVQIPTSDVNVPYLPPSPTHTHIVYLFFFWDWRLGNLNICYINVFVNMTSEIRNIFKIAGVFNLWNKWVNGNDFFKGTKPSF